MLVLYTAYQIIARYWNLKYLKQIFYWEIWNWKYTMLLEKIKTWKHNNNIKCKYLQVIFFKQYYGTT